MDTKPNRKIANAWIRLPSRSDFHKVETVAMTPYLSWLLMTGSNHQTDPLDTGNPPFFFSLFFFILHSFGLFKPFPSLPFPWFFPEWIRHTVSRRPRLMMKKRKPVNRREKKGRTYIHTKLNKNPNEKLPLPCLALP